MFSCHKYKFFVTLQLLTFVSMSSSDQMATALFLRLGVCRTAAHCKLRTTCRTLGIISAWLVSLNRSSSSSQNKTTMTLTQATISLASFSRVEKRFHTCKTSSYTGRNSVLFSVWDDQQWIQASTHGGPFSRPSSKT